MSTVQQIFSDVTITNFGKRIVDGVSQHRPLLKLLREKGQIERKEGGTAFTWNLEAGRHDVHVTSDDQDVSSLYTPRRRWQRPQLDWAQVSAFRRFSKDVLRQNAGAQALVRVRDREIPAMFRDALDGSTNSLMYQILNHAQGTYTGNGLPIYGLPAVFSAVTWADTAKEGTIGTGVSYAGLNISISGLAGTVDGVERDAWTPTAVNTTASVWSGGTGAQTFRDNVFEILTYAQQRGSRFSSSDPMLKPDCGLLTQSMFIDLQTKLEGKQTIFIQRPVTADTPQGIGTSVEKQWHNGLPYYWENWLPADTGYILNLSQMGLCMLPKVEWGDVSGTGMKTSGDGDDWFEVDVDYNPGRRGLTVSITWNGQFWFNPRYVVQMYAGA